VAGDPKSIGKESTTSIIEAKKRSILKPRNRELCFQGKLPLWGEVFMVSSSLHPLLR